MTNYSKKSFIQERLALVFEYEKIKNKRSKRSKKIKDLFRTFLLVTKTTNKLFGNFSQKTKEKMRGLEEYSEHKRKAVREWYLKFIQSDKNPEVLLFQKKVPDKILFQKLARIQFET